MVGTFSYLENVPSFAKEGLARLYKFNPTFNPTEHSRNAIIMLVGTKTDQEQRRKVQKKEAIELAKELDGSHWEISAREGRGIHEMFLCLALLLLQRQPNAETRKSFLNRAEYNLAD
jgi:GTPase SAR1 family protein